MQSPPGSPATLRLSSLPTVAIEVQDREGQPVPDALVRWRGQAVAAVGPDGRCSLAVPAGEPLLASRQGWGARIGRPEGSGAAVLPIRLKPLQRIAGKVVDLASGRPVAGALVWSGWPLLAPVARTNAEGAFQIEVPPGEESWLQGAAAGFLQGERQPVRPGAADSNVLKLTPAAVLSGIVVDAAGRPVAGVQIVTELSDRSMFMKRPSFAVAQSDKEGGFRLTGLRPGEGYELRATHEGFSLTKLTVRTTPARSTSEPLRVVMKRGAAAFGRVVNEAGQAVAGAEVKLIDSAGETAPKARSDQEGRFEFRHLGAARYDLRAQGQGYSYAIRSGIEIPSGETPFDLGTVTLPAGAVIEGRVTDARGGVIEGADIDAMPSQLSEMTGEDWLWDIQTGADGKFRLEGLRRGEPYDVTVDRPGYVTTTVPGIEAPTEEPIQIRMKAARSLAGRVVGPAGEPVAGAALSRIEELRFADSMSISGSSLGSSDTEGRFRVTGLPAGIVSLAVQAEGYETRKIEGLEIPEERDLEGVEITLQHGTVLEVQVLDAAGEPAHHVSVYADPEKPPDLSTIRSWRPIFAQTDYRGRCRLSVTGHEAYRVKASKGFLSATARVVAGSGSMPVELRLPPGVEVSGRVLGGGETARDASAHLENQDRTDSSVPVTVDGGFVFTEVPDGSYRLQARSRGGKVSASLEVTIAGRPLRDLELRIDREDERATLSGRILGLSPEKLRGISVNASPTSGGQVVAGTIGPEGEYRIEKLAPGEWLVQAHTASSRMATATVEIESGVATAIQDLEFPSGSLTLSGRVLLDGAPLVGAGVGAAKQGGVNMSGLVPTAWDGSFTLSDLQAGSVTLFIFNLSGIGASRAIELTESQEMVIELTTGRLRGTVVEVSGEPVENALVKIEGLIQASAPGFPAATLRSGPDGAFQSPRLASGMYQLTIEKEGFAPTKLTTEVPAGDESHLEIRLTPGP